MNVSTVRALFLGIYSLHNVCIAPSVLALFLLLLATAKNRLHSEGRKSHSLSLKLDQAKHRPSRRSPRPILRVGNWGVGSKAVPTFHEEGEVQVLSPGTCTSDCLPPALPCFALPWPQSCLPRAGFPALFPVLYSHAVTRIRIHLGLSATHLCPTRGKSLRFSPF